jgi:hypothetical protein
MKELCFLCCALACLDVSGQTNAPLVSPDLFCLTPIRLRARVEEGTVQPVKADPAIVRYSKLVPDFSEPYPEAITSIRNERQLVLEYLRDLNGASYLTAPTPPSESRFTRALEAVFVPEVIKVGKVSVSCSVITAIKRKNPFCLLNPMFVSLSW